MCDKGRPEGADWFERLRIWPRSDRVLGIGASEIDPSWVRAALLRKEHFAVFQGANASVDRLFSSGAAGFAFDGDADRDGRPDRVAVGVYEDASGKSGSFVLVATRRSTGEWAELATFRGSSPDPKAGNFSVLVKRKGRVDWCVFLPCRNTGEGNDGNTITWSRKQGFHLIAMPME